METVLALGLLVGMKHAIEADHVAAVASLTTQSRNKGDAVNLGIAWGLGHTATLFCVGAVVLSLDAVLPARVAVLLEFLVGIMLVGLGADVIRRLIQERIHYHVHRHNDGVVHLHAHSHLDMGRTVASSHEHRHVYRMPLRALAVGLMHGMAGSAALIIFALGEIDSLGLAIAYMGLFGIGSMVGMAALSFAIAVPLRLAANSLTWAHNGLNATIGLATVGIGGWAIYSAGFAEGLIAG